MLRSALPPALTILGAAALVALAFAPSYLNYDTRYALVWASDLAAGHTPGFEAPFAPTPHPLWNLLALLVLPFGGAAEEAMMAIVLLSFGALVWLVHRLGAALFGLWAGVVAAVVVLTRAAILRDVVLAYLDVAFAALVVGAVLLEVRRPRRGTAVLVVLALAGLLRPEAWALAVLYVGYLWRGLDGPTRARYAVLALAPAVVWFASDALITGDPLHSLHGTSALAEENERRRSLSDVPYWTVQYFGFILRLPVLIGIPVGIWFAWRRGIARSHIPLVVAALLVLGFAAGPLFGLPLIGRYLRTPAALLAVFFGAACLGWLRLAPSKERTRWAAAGIALLVLSAVYVPPLAGRWDDLRTRRDREARYYDSLRGVVESAPVRAAFERCPDLTASDHRPVPHVRWWLDGAPGTVRTTEDATSAPGSIFLTPRHSPFQRASYGEDLPAATPPAGRRYVMVAGNRHWTAWAVPGCRA